MMIIDPNDTPFQSAFKKVAEAGWLQQSIVKDQTNGQSVLMGVKWTDKAKEQAAKLLGVFEEIEKHSHALTPDEMREVIQFAKLVKGPDWGGLNATLNR